MSGSFEVAKNADNTYFELVEATLTKLARKTKEVVRPVQAGKEVVLTEHGKPIAKIVPIRKTDRKRLAEAVMALGPIDLPSRK